MGDYWNYKMNDSFLFVKYPSSTGEKVAKGF